MNDRLRIGDAERDDAARELGEHFALGRISVDEHAERLELIWSARTRADLEPAFRDLPRPGSGRAAPSAAPSAASTAVSSARGWWPEAPRVPFLFKALVGIVALWWGFHHLLFLLIAVAVYVVVIRRFVHRRRRGGRFGGPGPWQHARRYQAGWH